MTPYSLTQYITQGRKRAATLQISGATPNVWVETSLGSFGGSGSGSQWLGAFSVPVHPLGIVSVRQRDTRTLPTAP
jgi:hypothetical protein